MNPPPALRLAKRHFDTLDLTRMIAAVAVLFWHYQHFFVPDVLPYGFHVNRRATEPLYALFAIFYDYGHLAVQYFWAVSGFVFAHVYLADDNARGRFWPARLARLWPLHLLTLCLVALLQTAYHARHGHYFIYAWNDTRHFVLNMFMAQSWGFQNNESFNGPTWSLSTEILAYAVFWVALPALRRVPFAMLAAIAVGAVAILPARYPTGDVLGCILYFFAGTGLYLLLLRDWFRPALLVPLAAGLLLAGWVAWTFWRLGTVSTPAAVIAVVALAAAVDLADTRRILSFGKTLGDASYGIYLWHFPLQIALVLAVPAIQTAAGHAAFLALFIGGAIAAGFASHAWIERPAQRAVLRWFDRLRQPLPAAT